MRRVVIGTVAAIMLVGLVYGSWSIFDVDVEGAHQDAAEDGVQQVVGEPPPATDADALEGAGGAAGDAADGDAEVPAPDGDAEEGPAGGRPAADPGTVAPTPTTPAGSAETPAPAGAQDPAAAALRRAAAAYEDVRALQADFVLQTENPLLRRTTTSRGTLFQRSPDRLLLRFSDPAGDRVVVDGTWIWTWYPSADSTQVIRTRAGEGAGGVDLRAQFIGDPERRFQATHTGTEAVGGRPADVLRLVPRDGGQPFRELRVWVDRGDGLARRFEIVETNGAVRRFDLSGLRVNPQLADALFRFDPPAGVRVITAGG